MPGWVGRAVGLDVHRDFCVVGICEGPTVADPTSEFLPKACYRETTATIASPRHKQVFARHRRAGRASRLISG